MLTPWWPWRKGQRITKVILWGTMNIPEYEYTKSFHGIPFNTEVLQSGLNPLEPWRVWLKNIQSYTPRSEPWHHILCPNTGDRKGSAELLVRFSTSINSTDVRCKSNIKVLSLIDLGSGASRYRLADGTIKPWQTERSFKCLATAATCMNDVCCCLLGAFISCRAWNEKRFIYLQHGQTANVYQQCPDREPWSPSTCNWWEIRDFKGWKTRVCVCVCFCVCLCVTNFCKGVMTHMHTHTYTYTE